MKKLIAMTLLLAGAGLIAPSAQAIVGTPIWGCTIIAQLENNSATIGIGVVNKNGPAKIRCTSLEHLVMGVPFSKKAYISIEGPAVGLDLNFVSSQRVYMASGSIGVRKWDELIGTHTVSLSGDINVLFLEGGAKAGVEFSDSLVGLRRSIELSSTHGLGATLSLQKMTVFESKADYLKAKALRKELRRKAEKERQEWRR